jgi:cytochrome c oxidase assembly protein subunit 15
MGVGLLIIILAAQAWRRARVGAPSSPWLATAALVWVCVQGAFGALTVTMKLQPIVVTAHLLGGVGLLALLVWLALREGPQPAADARVAALRPLALVALIVVLVQVALGGWVSSNYAVLACPDFPRCQGQWLPPMDFAHGFSLWRPLGMTGAGELIPFQALVAVHWVHRVFAVIVVVVAAALVVRAWKLERTAGLAQAILTVLVLQLATGLSNVVLQWPLAAAVLHSGGAALLVALVVALLFHAAAAARR